MSDNRRDFFKKAALTGMAGMVAPGFLSATENLLPQRKLEDLSGTPEPSAAQKSWMDLKFGLFVHFGINTYYDKEWSDGTLDPVKYLPTELDTDQWCSAAKDAGMNYIVLVTKHHDGFCNWPTQQTEYSVKNSPLKIDLVGRVVDSAKKFGLKVGFYYSLWDRNEPSHDKDEYAYVEFMKKQLQELLTEYGEIVELWFDGMWKKQASGWKKADGGFVTPEEFARSWRLEGAYRWQIDHVYQFIKRIQPNCLVMNNATTEFPGTPLFPVDLLSGEKATKADKHIQNVWNWLGKDYFFPLQIETTCSAKGQEQFKSGNWFWHESDHSVRTKEEVLVYLETAKKLNANLLLNVGPMANGKLRPEDIALLQSLKK